MDDSTSNENTKKVALDHLSKEELIKRCERLLILAQKAKQAKDILQEENNDLKNKLEENVSNEIIERLTQQKLENVNTIEQLKQELKKCEEKNNELDSENVSFKRRVKRLTDENEQLLTDLENLEKQMEECKRLGLEQQKQLLALEQGKQILQTENKSNNEKVLELQVALNKSLDDVEALKLENNALLEKVEILKINLSEKDKNILVISEELQEKEKIVTNEDKLKEKLKLYHGKIVKLAGNIKAVKENKNEILTLFKTYTQQVEEWKEQLGKSSENLSRYIEEMTAENKLLKENNAKMTELLEAHKTDDEKSKELNQFEIIKTENLQLNEEVHNLLDQQTKYKNKIEKLIKEKEAISRELSEMVAKHEEELKVFDDQSKKDTREIQNRIEENEKICIEYRKIISKLEEDLEVQARDLDELKRKNSALEEALEHTKETEQQMAERTSEEILKLVQENAQLLKLTEKSLEDKQSQTEDDNLEDLIGSLKRENSELLTEMHEMNQALKKRGEAVSKLQQHCDENTKKLHLYEAQANRNVDSETRKEEIIKSLEEEICRKEREISELKERGNNDNNSSYADSEAMSTSTISRSEDLNRIKDLEGSWEERYGKLRSLAIKLKGKVRELSSELLKEQNEKNNVQQKCANQMKTVAVLQSQIDAVQDEIEEKKGEITKLEAAIVDNCKDKQKLEENEKLITVLKKEIEDLKQEKTNTESWKKQISAKVQTLRKELEANKLVKKDYEAKIAKLTSDLEAKELALKAESDGHQQTRNSLEHSNNERKKNSVLNLEMQDYERSVKELSQKLEKKQEEITKLKGQLESQKSTSNAIREQNKLLEERFLEVKSDLETTESDLSTLKRKISDLEDLIFQKDSKIQSLTQLLESTRTENEELSTELSKVISEHQKNNSTLKTEKEQLRTQVLGLQQTLREVQDCLKLKEDELKVVQNDYHSYKVRAQSVLRQNQSRDVGLEERLSEQVSTLKMQCQDLNTELDEAKHLIEKLKKINETLVQEKNEIFVKFEEVTSEVEDLKTLYEQLSTKHQQTMIEHSETVRSLKVHAETLSQCYRQQLSEQEVRHNREIIELQNKIEKAPSPELPLPQLLTMPREEGEGSESTETVTKTLHPVPLERLLLNDSDQEIGFIKKQLSEEESKVIHLTALLADTEQDLAKHVQMNKLLKEEIRRQQRSVEREKHAENLEYLKNVVFKFLTLQNGDERVRLIPVLNTILKLSPEETQKLNLMAKGDPGRGWSNYLSLWPSPSKT